MPGAGDQTLAFHAAPPPGQWINDPNGLVHAGGAYRLFVQHREDPPACRRTGWARFSSDDLLRWTFDGGVIPPSETDWAYSGSIVPNADRLEAIYTAHDDGIERQVRRFSADAGLNWSEAEAVAGLGAPARNRRDPFVFRDGAGWALLLAEPCDWTDWASQPPSRLRLYRTTDRVTWREAGTIGPWRPAGIMWEVPFLVTIDGHAVLFVSEVDRREGGAACSVRAWVGTLEESGFVPADGMPAEGQPVDHGPDFYAMIPCVAEHWPAPDRVFVGWTSNWQNARDMPWPGFSGGPISLPRCLSIEDVAGVPVVRVRPMPSLDAHFSQPVSMPPRAGLGRLAFTGGHLVLTLRAPTTVTAQIEADFGSGRLSVSRYGSGALDWTGTSRFATGPQPLRAIKLFIDGPVVELFIDDGVGVTMALDTSAQPMHVEARVDGAMADISWMQLPSGRTG